MNVVRPSRDMREFARRLWGNSGEPHIQQLDSGLDLCVIEDHRLPIVSTVLAYRVGTRDELKAEAGAAHFLEHMMFKGSAKFGPGDIDRVTEANGGSNNAFTSHDVTAYYFSFARDYWTTALEIEIDRMGGLRLEADEVDSERQVILEELAMYESDPWDVLHQKVSGLLYGDHPYGQSVLGTRASLAGLGPAELDAFHRKHYRADNAVLTVVGDVDLAEVQRWADRMPGGAERKGRRTLDGIAEGTTQQRFSREFGEVSRLLLAFPAPAGDVDDHVLARLLSVCLAGGRSSRLNQTLVEEEQLAVWVAADVTEMAGPATLSIALEAAPGIEHERIEQRLFEELANVRRGGVSADELARAQKMTVSDWTFAHERVQRRAMTSAMALSTFDGQHPQRSMAAVLGADPAGLGRVAEKLLVPERSVVAWSFPEASRSRADVGAGADGTEAAPEGALK